MHAVSVGNEDALVTFTYPIVNSSEDFIVHERASIRRTDRDIPVVLLEPILRVRDVHDEERCTCVSNCGVDVGRCPTHIAKVAGSKIRIMSHRAD